MRKLVATFERLAKRLLINEEGVVAIEFGIIASLLILMLLGATDLGFAARHRSQMESAVRAGIQKAIKGGSVDAVKSAVLEAADLPTDPEATVTANKVCYDSAGDAADCDAANVSIYMEITLQQEHKWIIGLPFLANPSTLEVTNSVRVG
jgi:Flp pilus assembly protein TadG